MFSFEILCNFSWEIMQPNETYEPWHEISNNMVCETSICADWSEPLLVNVKLLTKHHLEFLSLKGSCTGWSESIHIKMPHCWKSHVAAHMFNYFSCFSCFGYSEEPSQTQGAHWLSGRVLDSRPRGCGFEPHRRHCVVVLEQDTFILA